MTVDEFLDFAVLVKGMEEVVEQARAVVEDPGLVNVHELERKLRSHDVNLQMREMSHDF